jgi:predicted double-glycine peptidase
MTMSCLSRKLAWQGLVIGAALWVSAIPNPAAAQVRLGNEAGGNFQVQVMSWWAIPFRSVVRQQYDFSCGSAAVATLLTYHYDHRMPESSVFMAMWEKGDRPTIKKAGFSMLDMKQYLDSIGYRTDGFRLTMDQLRQTQRPGIVLLDLKGYKHFVVVKGIRGDKVLVGDPMLGLGQYRAKEFAKLWNGIFLAIRAVPDKKQPLFNLAGDWGPWSTAPLQDGGLHVPVASLTNNLPFDYQISSEVLFDIRTATTR